VQLKVRGKLYMGSAAASRGEACGCGVLEVLGSGLGGLALRTLLRCGDAPALPCLGQVAPHDLDPVFVGVL